MTTVAGRPDGILLPKCVPEDVRTLDHYLSAFEASAGAPVGAIRIIAIATETPAEPGSPGPGETTIPRRSASGSVASASTPARSIASLRITRTSAPAACSAWTRLNVKLS